MPKEIKVDFWDCTEDCDRLTYDCMDEAIQSHLEANDKDLLKEMESSDD